MKNHVFFFNFVENLKFKIKSYLIQYWSNFFKNELNKNSQVQNEFIALLFDQ